MTQLMTVLPYIRKDWEFQQGLILGLSEIENPLSPCYVTLQTLEDTLLSAQYQVDFNQYARGVISKGNTPTDSGYITSIFEFLVDLSLIGFNFYKDCNLELILIVIGSFLSKSSSSFNYVNNMSYVMLQMYTDNSSDISILNKLTIDY